MEKVIKTEDRDRIKSIKMKYPELMNRDAEEIIAKKYFDLKTLGDSIQNYRERLWEMEREYNRAEKEFLSIKELCEIEFGSEETVYVTNDSTFAIHGHGNDIIGRTSK